MHFKIKYKHMLPFSVCLSVSFYGGSCLSLLSYSLPLIHHLAISFFWWQRARWNSPGSSSDRRALQKVKEAHAQRNNMFLSDRGQVPASPRRGGSAARIEVVSFTERLEQWHSSTLLLVAFDLVRQLSGVRIVSLFSCTIWAEIAFYISRKRNLFKC